MIGPFFIHPEAVRPVYYNRFRLKPIFAWLVIAETVS